MAILLSATLPAVSVVDSNKLVGGHEHILVCRLRLRPFPLIDIHQIGTIQINSSLGLATHGSSHTSVTPTPDLQCYPCSLGQLERLSD
jgi:hypothetical protein